MDTHRAAQLGCEYPGSQLLPCSVSTAGSEPQWGHDRGELRNTLPQRATTKPSVLHRAAGPAGTPALPPGWAAARCMTCMCTLQHCCPWEEGKVQSGSERTQLSPGTAAATRLWFHPYEPMNPVTSFPLPSSSGENQKAVLDGEKHLGSVPHQDKFSHQEERIAALVQGLFLQMPPVCFARCLHSSLGTAGIRPCLSLTRTSGKITLQQ